MSFSAVLTSNTNSYLQLQLGGSIIIRLRGISGSFGYEYYNAGAIATGSNTGKFRVVRDASNLVTVFYWNSTLSRWEWNGNVSGRSNGTISGSVSPSLVLNSAYGGLGTENRVDWDNFYIWDGCESVLTSTTTTSSSSSSSSTSTSSTTKSTMSTTTTTYAGLVMGSVCYGHDTDVEELWVRNFTDNWSGSGEITGSGDAEAIELHEGDSMEMNVPWRVSDTRKRVVIRQNKYGSGDNVVVKYKKGETISECNADTWHTYTGPFHHMGYIRLRVEK